MDWQNDVFEKRLLELGGVHGEQRSDGRVRRCTTMRRESLGLRAPIASLFLEGAPLSSGRSAA